MDPPPSTELHGGGLLDQHYITASLVAHLVEACGWGAIVIGAGGFIGVLITDDGSVVFAIPLLISGVALFFFGLLLVVMAETSRAVLDGANSSRLNANISKQILDAMKKDGRGKI